MLYTAYWMIDQRAYIPGNDEFNSIVSDDNVIVDMIKQMYKEDVMIIFTGTFRMYSKAVNISDTIVKESAG